LKGSNRCICYIVVVVVFIDKLNIDLIDGFEKTMLGLHPKPEGPEPECYYGDVCNILGSVSLHSIPPISGLEIMVHLIPSWMNGIRRLMCLTKYIILQSLDVRHTDPPFVPQHTFLNF
jgi:hypothetical protein